MGWSTVDWPPKNGSNIKPKPKLRKKHKKLISVCIILIFLFAGALGVGVLSEGNISSTSYINNYYQALLSKLIIRDEDKDKKANIEAIEKTEPIKQIESTEPTAQINNLSEQPRTRGLIKDNPQEISRGSSDTRYVKKIDMIATAYTHTGNPTASGSWPKVGVVAVDPSIIPIGTRLYIDGYGSATALDKGGAITGNKIDLFMDTEDQALRWGVRQVKVYIME